MEAPVAWTESTGGSARGTKRPLPDGGGVIVSSAGGASPTSAGAAAAATPAGRGAGAGAGAAAGAGAGGYGGDGGDGATVLPVLTKEQHDGQQRQMAKAQLAAEAEVGMLSYDAKWFGNLGRFLNHSCEPNCYKQPVFTGSQDLRAPRLGLFALADIPAMTELVYDYGYVKGSVEGKSMKCHCGEPTCRNNLY